MAFIQFWTLKHQRSNLPVSHHSPRSTTAVLMQYFHIEEYLSIMKTNNAIAIYILNILWIAGEIKDILNYTQDIIYYLYYIW